MSKDIDIEKIAAEAPAEGEGKLNVAPIEVTGELEIFEKEQSENNEIEFELPEGFMLKAEEGVVAEASSAAPAAAAEAALPLKKQRNHMGMKTKNTIANTIIYIVLGLMTIIWLFPFVGIVLESFRCESTSPVGYLWPTQWGFDNYVKLFTKTDFLKWFRNTFVMGLVVAVVQTLFVVATSYALSRYRFKLRKALMNLILILGMFPGFLTLILMYKFFSNLNLTQSLAPVSLCIIYCASSGMGYYVAKGFFDTIPKSLDEAGKIDGASGMQVFFKIILPLAKPILIYTILMAFMAPWVDFIMAKYMAHGTSAGMNVAVGLQSMISTDQSLMANYTTFCAGGVVVALPITILFMLLQKYYVAGVTGGAVKG